LLFVTFVPKRSHLRAIRVLNQRLQRRRPVADRDAITVGIAQNLSGMRANLWILKASTWNICRTTRLREQAEFERLNFGNSPGMSSLSG
jgi:hypothetical protein